MSFTSTVWRWNPSETANDGHMPITIEQCRQRDADYKYAVRQAGFCLNKTGEWEYEPTPSSRDDDFMARCRFDAWDDAAKCILKHCKPAGRFA